MKYIDEFRDGHRAEGLARRIAATITPGRSYRFMEFCGGHTHALARYGIEDLLPSSIRMVHGPGCPVCVLPIGRIDMAIRLALEHGVILCAYGDCLRVPASSGRSLLKARAAGGDIRMVYSSTDALQIARENPRRDVVFFAIGFETTTPATAVAVQTACRENIGNFSVLCAHVMTPPAMHALLGAGTQVDGLVGPAHVSIIIGTRPYDAIATRYRKPIVVSGFEPLDIMQSILMLIQQVNSGSAQVENQFTRTVNGNGNIKAQALINEVLEIRPSFEWRGLGSIASSAMILRKKYADFDAENRFALAYKMVPDNKACECGAILRGIKEPQDCAIFGTVCTPENPIGSCMVSSEGACASYFQYGRHRIAIEVV